MKQIGIIGWRGMVGSVLLERMREESDFDLLRPTFFSTSQAGAAAPRTGGSAGQEDAVQDANDIAALTKLPMLISTQGGEYTESVHPRLRAAGWQGYWIDAASALRMRKDAVIVLDPVNLPVMQRRAPTRHQGFHRRQLHRVAHADGRGRPAAGGRGGVDHRHDLPIRIRRRRAEYARIAGTNGRIASFGRGAAAESRRPAFWKSIAP